MNPYYHRLEDEVGGLTAVNCHTHHSADSTFQNIDLNEIFNRSYVGWSKEAPSKNKANRERYLDLVRYKSYFRSL